MADTQNLSTISAKDYSGYYIARQKAKLIKDGIENGSAPFLPNQNGQLNPILITNANTGMALNAKELIPAVLIKNKNNYQSNVVGTYGIANKLETSIKDNEKGIGKIFQGSDGENHLSSFFFAEQMKNPERLLELASQNAKWEQRLSNETFKIESPEITEYLGTYVAACKSGANVEVSPEVAEKFKTNILAVTENELKRTAAEKNPNIPKLSDLLFNADVKGFEIIKNREKELGIEPKSEQRQEKKHERKQERSQSMSF